MDEALAREAKRRIVQLTEKYNLNPNILKYFEQGKVYYSYLIAGGLIGSIDTISYDNSYENAVKEFEETYIDSLVYHAIETESDLGKMLSLLYVGPKEEDWAKQRLSGDRIMAYTINFTYPELTGFGYIRVSDFENSGALIRIG